jgi:haloalkane dehalogenase
MESIIGSLTWEEMPSDFRTPFRMMRTPGVGWLMVSVANMFVKKMLPDATHRTLSDEAQAHYASAFPTVASRKAVRQWPLEVPISGKPADNVAVIDSYRDWLTQTELPKLLFYANPGAIIRADDVTWCRENMSNLETVDIGDGIHFVQEDNPELIGSELAKWHAAL